MLFLLAFSHIISIFVDLSMQILDEMPVFYNLSSIEKREVLIIILQIIRNLDDASLIKAWQQSIARTRLFFKLLEESLSSFEVTLYFLLQLFPGSFARVH